MLHIPSFKDFIAESIYTESGIAGLINTALGPKQGRVVISGPSVEKNQDRILAAVLAVDKTGRAEFFAKTGKIVGVIANAALKDLQKELRRIDGSLTAEIKTKSLR
jgi:hypothetical protein